VSQQFLQIFEIEQQQALVVGKAEGDREHPGLGVVDTSQDSTGQGAKAARGSPNGSRRSLNAAFS
jgi:hypothetical protein